MSGKVVVDLFAFTAGGQAIGLDTKSMLESDVGAGAGWVELAGFQRLIDGLPAQVDAPVKWSLQGEITSSGRRFVHISARTQLVLECQRCLQPFVQPVQADNRLEVVRWESELDRDEDLDAAECIVGSTHFDVLALVEDELILSLPSMPRHDVCPSQPGLSTSDEEPQAQVERPSPFAVLAQLKKD